MRHLLHLALLGLAISSAVGCSVREDGAPRIIPVEQQQLDDSDPATGEEAEGAGRIFLLRPVDSDEQTQLRSVRRTVSSSPRGLLDSLLRGANEDEIAIGLNTALPADLEIDSVRTVGTRLTIDVNDALNELSNDGLRQALAQIVATATEIGQVQQVRIRVDGENQAWPTGDGEVTDLPLSIYDFPGFLETSQPPFPALPA